MRTINTVEADYRSSHRRFANAEELFAYSQSAKQISSARALKERLNPAAIQPFVLRVVTDARGEHYSATVKFPSDIHDQSSWCKTEVFSDDSGLISLGQNIECTGANSLGAHSWQDGWAGGPCFDLFRVTTTVGAPSFAHSAEGGNDEHVCHWV